jgi:peroxiredoxin
VDTEIVGVSANARFSQQAFADFLKLNFPLVSDAADVKTITAYGVLIPERRVAQRSYFIIDKQGVVRFKKVLAPKEPLLSNEALLAEVAKIK